MKRIALVVMMSVAAPVAYAQPKGLTEEFQAGTDAYRLGKYDEARKHLEKARDLDPKLPGPYRFLAAVAKAQGRWDDCIANSRKALEANPKSAEAGDTRKVHDECRESAGRIPYREELGDGAAVAVTTSVAGATVQINGLTYGGTPLAPRPITAGLLEVEIEKQGWKPVKLTVNALSGIVTDVIVELEADPTAQSNVDINVETKDVPKIGWLLIENTGGEPWSPYTLSIDGSTTPIVPQIEIGPGTHTIELTRPAYDPWRRRVRISSGQKTQVRASFTETAPREAYEKKGFYVLGASGVMLLGGFITAGISRDAANEARDIHRIERARDTSAANVPVRTRADFDDARDKASRFSLISNVTYAVGLATAGVGAYFLLKGARERTDVPPPFAVAPTRGGVFVAKEVAW